ncbi:phage portal protein [Mesorhizobium sp.]|uniref:phage portal protein n=1 Tax=Mesorhizobium sp. TaxID=1871066 RepID=UPI000FE65A5A|nr:phage portal protein [Mesorhizobium sp.]RWN33439.1 MAG: phage portal protein [Mesorhizobium sp.]
MNILGLFNISRTKAAPPVPVSENRGGWYRIFESFTGAWQQNVTVDFNSVLANHAVFACMTLIASDISKLRVKLVEQDDNGIWTETKSPAFSPVLKKPNRFQNRIQYWENYFLSKLMRGNVYVLKIRDGSRVVRSQIVLAPDRVTPLVADDGSVFYHLRTDNVSGIKEDIMVPASEIIHDRFNCLFHPLVGLSPIYAAGVAATQGLSILDSSTQFFGNRSRPGGVLTAPGAISQQSADNLKALWDANFTGENAGKIAVVGDGLKFEPIAMNATDSQLIEQLKWTAEVVCSTFHVPPYKIGVGQMPTNNNVQALNVEYYSQCLQVLIEAAELCQDEALGFDTTVEGKTLGTEFDIDNLLRMDSVAQMETLDKGKNVLTPNEARKRLDLPPVAGGEAVYRQQQDFSLLALSKRDAKDDPFATSSSTSAKVDQNTTTGTAPAANDNLTDEEMEDAAKAYGYLALKALPAVFTWH